MGSDTSVISRKGKRAKNGAGSIFPRKDSTGKVIGYVAQLDLGRVKGKRKRRNFYGATAKEVQDRMQQAREEHRKGPVPDKLTVKMWLLRWLDQQPDTRPSTLIRYRGLVDRYLIPDLGHIALQKLTPSDVRQMLMDHAAPKGVTMKRHTKGLRQRSLHHLRAVLRTALGRAVKDGILTRNAAQDADAPKVKAREMTTFNHEQAEAFRVAIQGDPDEALFTLALATGMRKGEILGLRWKDVDLDAATLRVTGALQRIEGRYELVEPKTEKSRRALPLPGFVVDLLREHKVAQSKERLRLGKKWFDTFGLVFTQAHGQPHEASAVTRRFQKVCDTAGLPHIRFHDLRHFAASYLIERGVSVRVVMELLGHSTIATTLNTYTHVTPESLRTGTADIMQSGLGG